MDDDVESEYKGLPSSLVESEKIERYENLYLKKQSLEGALSIKYATYQDLKSDIQYDIQLSQYEDSLNKERYMTALSLYQSERNRQDTLNARKEDKEFQVKMAQFQEENKRYSIEKQFENQTKLLKFKEEMEKNNKAGGQYLDDGEGNLVYIKNGERLNVLEGLGKKILADQDSDYDYQIYNKDGITTVVGVPKRKGLEITHETFDINGDRVSTPMKVQTAIVKCKDNKQCGAGVNDYLQNLGGNRVFGNSYESKKSNINSDTPIVGGIAVWNPGVTEEQKKYGHVGIVTGIDGDMLEITDWNWKGDEKKMVHKVPRSQVEFNGGYYNPDGIEPKEIKVEGYKDENVPMYKYFLEKGKLDSTDRKTFDDSEYTIFKKEALNYQNKLNEQGTAQKEKVIGIAQELLKFIDEKEVTRTNRLYSENTYDFLKTETLSDYQANFDSFISNLSLDNLVELKSQGATFGALSNQELGFIKESATKLKSGLSDKAFKEEVNNVIEVLSKGLSQERKNELGISSNKNSDVMTFTTSSGFSLNYGTGATTGTTQNLYEGFFNQ